MKNLFTIKTKFLMVLVAFASIPFSQLKAQFYYKVNYVDSAKNPLGINTDGDATSTGWTNIVIGPQSTNFWSDTVAIPFDFEYYGSKVTHFRASQNALITFTKNPTKLPSLANTNLPSDSLPDSTIACFWQPFTYNPPTGSGDNIQTKVFGTAPYRHFYIRYFSFEIGTSSFTYFALALEETTNKIYIVDMSYFSGTSNFTVGVQLDDKVAVQYGDSTLTWAKTSSSTNTNNSYYEFTPFRLSNNDLSVLDVTQPSLACGLTSSETIKAYVFNSSPKQMDTIPMAYRVDGGTVVRETFYKSIGSAQYDTLTFTTKADLSSNKPHIVEVWGEYPNDPINANDTASRRLEGLSGTYTIGQNEDFESFSEAVAAINRYSVCGNVTFEVKSGTYIEQITLREFLGASANNTVTFTSESGDSSDVVLQFAQTGTSDNYVIMLDGGDWYRIRNITIKSTSTSAYSRLIEVKGGAENNIFSNNFMEAPTASSTSTNYCLVYSGTDLDNHNSFINNKMQGGSYGFYWYGTSTSVLEEGTVIEGNEIDAYYYGMRLYYQDAPVANQNTYQPTSSSTTLYGIYAGYCDNGVVISNNKVLFPGVNGYGIYLFNCDGTSSSPAMVYNNMVSIGNTSTAYALYNNASSYAQYYYNSINVVSTGTSYAMFVTSTASSNVVINNNILANQGGSYAFYVPSTATSAIIDMDYNLFYTTGTNLAFWGSAVSNLSALQTANSMDANSLESDPAFFSNSDLHTKNPILDEAAKVISGITTDIDGDIRDTTSPDIGADEFTPVNNDLKLAAILSPTGGCGDSNTVITVVVENMGLRGQTSIPIEVTINGTITISQTFSHTLASTETDTFTLSGTFNTYQGGTFKIFAKTALSNEQDFSNDTASTIVSFNAIPAQPIGFDVARCGQGAIDLEAKSPNNLLLSWYDAPTGGNEIASGNKITTNISNTTSLYVEAADLIKSSMTTTFNDNNGCSSGNMFDITTTSAIAIDSFELNFSATTNGYVRIYYKSGTYANAISDSTQWTFLGDANVSPNTRGNATRVSVGKSLDIPAGTTYGIYIEYNAAYTNGSATYTTDHFTLTAGHGHCSDWSTGIADRIWNGTLFYRGLGCPSPRTQIVATVNLVPTGLSTTIGTPFNGIQGAGTLASPDTMCVSDTLSYELTPPTGYANSGFGTTWVITSLVAADLNGVQANSTNVVVPSSSGNGVFQLFATNGERGKLIQVEVVANIIGSTCDTTFSRYIYVAPNPKAEFTVNDNCAESEFSFINSSSFGSYDWNFGDNTNSSQKNPKHVYSTDGSFSASLTVESTAGCKTTRTKSVTAYELPTVIASATNACEGSALNFTNNSSVTTGSISSYSWNFGDGLLSNRANPSHAFQNHGTYSVVLKATTNNGCMDSSTVDVEIFETPQADFTAMEGCQNALINFNDNSSYGGANANLSYNWKFEDGQESNDQNTDYSFAEAGFYNVTLTVSTTEGCIDSVSQFVRVNAAPVAGFSTEELCFGSTTEFSTRSSINGGTITAYEWTIEGMQVQGSTVNYDFDSIGQYTISHRVVTAKGCEASTMETITIFDVPNADFTVVNACANSNVTIANLSSSPAGNLIFQWNFGNGSLASGNLPTHQYADAGTYDVTLVATDSNGCSNNMVQRVTIYELPSAEFTFGHMGYGRYNFTPNETGLSSYVWDFGNGETSIDENPEYKFETEGLKMVTLTTTNSNSCTTSHLEYLGVSTDISEPGENFNEIQIYPNPFTEFTNITYQLKENSQVSLALFDMSGKEISTLVNSNTQTPGIYQYTLQANIPSGVYFVQFIVDGTLTMHKVVKTN